MKIKKIPYVNLKKNHSFLDSVYFTARDRTNLFKIKPFKEEKKSQNISLKIKEFLKAENLKLIQNSDIKKVLLNFSKSILHNSKSEILKKSKSPKIKVKKNNSMISNYISNNYNNNSINNSINNFNLFDYKGYKSHREIASVKLKNMKHSIFPLLNLTSNYVIKGASDFSNNKRIESEEINYTRKYLFKNSLKILKAQDRIIKGELNPLFFTKKKFKKTIQDTCFSKINFMSKKLGSISLFGVFDGHGKNALEISKYVKNYFLDYFENSNSIKVCLSHDNYYSILTEAFLSCQNNLITNKEKLNIDVDFSGVTCCLVLYPNDSNNNLYCANCGDCKCVLYSNSSSIKLTYPHNPERPSESQRLLERRIALIQNNINNNINNDDNYNNISNNEENEIHQNLVKMNYIDKIKEKDKFEKKKNLYLKKFIKLNISRSLGDLQTKELGIIPNPEIIESNLKIDRGKICVIGTSSLWKYLSEEEVGNIVRKHARENDTYSACKELEELARERWKKNMRRVDDITCVIIFFEDKR